MAGTNYIERGSLLLPRSLNESAGRVDVEGLEARLQETTRAQEAVIFTLRESLIALELELAQGGYLRAGAPEHEFSKGFINGAAQLARMMYLKNPLINNAASTTANYVFGQGFNITAPDADINEVIQDHLNDPSNQKVLYDQHEKLYKEIELECDGNFFITFFSDAVTGRVQVRFIPLVEIQDVYRDPNDRSTPWYYKRVWTADVMNEETGEVKPQTNTYWYPDWRYNPTLKRDRLGALPVDWERPIYHVKVGAFSDWKFGLTEFFNVLDWAKSYKEFLEDRASVARTLAKIAAQMVTKGGAKGPPVAATKFNQAQQQSLDQTLHGSGVAAQLGLSNPPAQPGGVLINSEAVKYQAVSMGGATIHPDEGRRYLLMVAAGVQMPEVFFGDADVGNHATAQMLARPTEFKFTNRQTLWVTILLNILNHVLLYNVAATGGKLRHKGVVALDADGVETVTWDEGVDASVKVEFPAILQHDMGDVITGITNAATLAGNPMAGTLDLELTARLLLMALGVKDVDAEMEKWKMSRDEQARQAAQKATPDSSQAQADNADPATEPDAGGALGADNEPVIKPAN